MTHRRPDLPDYANPPVVEVALSVQFDRLPKLRTPYFGIFWNQFRENFPHVEDHAPLHRAVETFGARVAPRPTLRLLHSDQEPPVRAWFLNSNRTELIQLQQDRFVHNWRKIGQGVTGSHPYPRYEYIVGEFEKELAAFEQLIGEYDLGNMVPNQCEVTYINHITRSNVWSTHSEVQKVISCWSDRYTQPIELGMENMSFEARYIIEANNDAVGRLHVALQPAFRQSDDEPIFVLTLTARGRPQEENREGVIRFLNQGREHIVKGFTSLTTQQMHKAWGRKDI